MTPNVGSFSSDNYHVSTTWFGFAPGTTRDRYALFVGLLVAQPRAKYRSLYPGRKSLHLMRIANHRPGKIIA